jgi:D-alanyl-lipoteichoic acid acyltransferase DltB (MBOAT superfamily)
LLPVGISFYTFQSLSYSLEIYNGKQKAERHFGIFALYISFFPQLVAGPIERFSHLGGQLKQYFDFRWDNISNGLRLILFGLFVKMVIADNISSYVDEVYQNFNQFNSGSILQGLFLYSFQIYADFYGYSIIAIGSARLLGIDLMNNFASPYLAKSIPEFWNRWHISLSTWFKDYLFIPLGGSRVKISRFYLNILVIFTVSGLWHGANWTFLIWGFLHAVFYILYNYLVKRFNIKFNEDNWSVINVSRAIVNFLLVTFAWIFFRSSTFTEAISLIKSIYFNINLIDSFSIPIHVFILLFIFIVSDILFSKNRIDVWLQNKSYFVRWSIYFVIVFLILTQSGVNNNPFIYFQF